MYSCQVRKTICFSTMDEALAILPIHLEFLFHDYMEKCIPFLDVDWWNFEKESQLPPFPSSLQINSLHNIATTLGIIPCKLSCEHLETLEKFTFFLLSTSTWNTLLHVRLSIHYVHVGGPTCVCISHSSASMDNDQFPSLPSVD
jgi:hypothetical protein